MQIKFKLKIREKSLEERFPFYPGVQFIMEGVTLTLIEKGDNWIDNTPIWKADNGSTWTEKYLREKFSTNYYCYIRNTLTHVKL